MAKILLSIPDTLLKKLDDYCAEHDYERSEAIRGLVRQLLETTLPPVKVVGDLKSIPTSTIPPENTYVKSGTMPVENNENKDDYGYCEGHWDSAKRKFNRKLVTVEDNNGTEILTRKWLCPKCIEKLEANVGNYGGHIDYL